jgi:two-component system, chemotaxis family, sensor kinase CheA
MEQFKKKFLEEANDLINSLEDVLLMLEEKPGDKAIIGDVFRVMHSLKGGSSMFGFDKIDAFTHQLENIYDLIRNDALSVTPEILDITLASVDHLKVLLENSEELSGAHLKAHQQLLERIHQVQGEKNSNHRISSSYPEEVLKTKGDTNQALYESVPTYFIRVNPHSNIFLNGTNPFLLIDELHTLGHCKAFVKTQAIPELKEVDAERCYLQWEVFLATNNSIDSIKDVFIFVEDSCDVIISKVADENLLAITPFIQGLEEFMDPLRITEQKELEEFIATIILSQSVKEDEGFSIKTDEAGPVKKLIINNIRVSSDKLDSLMNLVSELVTMQASLSLFAENHHLPGLSSIAENIEKISRQLRDNTFEICLIPIETIMIRFKRLVRDLSIELDKEIQFIAEGTETELDKSIIDGLTEPLMHIFRNAIDHGIESAEERLAKGKPRQGKIILKAFYSGTHVFIQVKDDGKGIDVEKIRQKAILRGFITPEANLSYKELLNLVFLPGFTTAAKITEVSGRGVGLDVVVKKIADIRGEVEIESQLGIGTTFTIKLPLTLSIIDGLLVKIHHTSFVIPLSSVDKCFEVPTGKVNKIFNNKIMLDGKMVPLVNLREEFKIDEGCPDIQQIIQVNHDVHKIGMTVDVVLGEYQAVLKPLGRMYKDLEIISGATILGDGTIALVLDPGRIINTFDRETMLKREKFYKNLGKKAEIQK